MQHDGILLCKCYSLIPRPTKLAGTHCSLTGFHLEENVSSRRKCLGGKCLEIAQHEVPCDILEGVAHCTVLISEHQASCGGMVEVSS